jgi:hypothetical protein
MATASQAITDFNKIMSVNGGSLYHYAATSGLLNDWGEISKTSMYAGSTVFIGILQEDVRDLNRLVQGNNVAYDAVCYTSGNSFNVCDKIKSSFGEYEISNVKAELIENQVIYRKLELKTL